MSQYDYLVVGAGLSGAVFANAAKRAGKSVLVIDRRDHIAGNVYTEDVEGIHREDHTQHDVFLSPSGPDESKSPHSAPW